ncbi:ABC transporter ATP-binding protein [Pseudoclavibacter sp. 13-3]|uniref:ABC transporter ATP-binding protein n=1 Tax=Pseudoclavibacter sp. 13-3 TaxID=2901228 RepID=UPI001E2B0737|nr:ABC transporter ATP-binding protein [Pseudoclavibacter sp. 13-3]MCD7102376.1 ABC transporter ATP-binding protein [Pseudoclavibacter sp. 13-3]
MIEARDLSKRYGSKTAVDHVTFRVEPGRVTGFLGPNGAGKSTTMRLALGLDRPTTGAVTVNGRRYADQHAPLHEVGALLDATAVHRGRSARSHLRALAATHGIPDARVDEVIAMAGLESVADKRSGGFSLGMGQRLGIAAALLGDPDTLILDEPVNGLDPDGVVWVRQLLRYEASKGKTVLVSSHLMAEMAQTADHLIVLGRGRVLADTSLQEFIAHAGRSCVRVRSPQSAALAAELQRMGGAVTPSADGSLSVTGLDAAVIGQAAADTHAVLHELHTVEASLEQAYLELTENAVQYNAGSLPEGAHA